MLGGVEGFHRWCRTRAQHSDCSVACAVVAPHLWCVVRRVKEGRGKGGERKGGEGWRGEKRRKKKKKKKKSV